MQIICGVVVMYVMYSGYVVYCRWRRGVVVIAAAEFHLTKPELRFCASSNPSRGVSENRDGEDL